MKEVSCSGLKLVYGKTVCIHGFMTFPSCFHNPMEQGIYSFTPCMDERYSERYLKETGKPIQLIIKGD